MSRYDDNARYYLDLSKLEEHILNVQDERIKEFILDLTMDFLKMKFKAEASLPAEYCAKYTKSSVIETLKAYDIVCEYDYQTQGF